MSVEKLTSRQIFGMKRTSVEKRIGQYYEETKDAASVLQYVFALLLRNALSVTDFSGMLEAIVQEILLQSEPDDTMRSLAPFFKNYFNSGDWNTVIARVYKRKKDYLAFDEALYHYKKFILEKKTPIEELETKQYKFVSVFLKEDGKTHTWSLRDADPNISNEKWQAVLELITTLTVFEKEGTGLFVELVNSDLMDCTRRSLFEKKRSTKKMAQKDEKNATTPKEKDIVQSAANEDKQAMEIALPSDAELEKLSREELRKIVEEQLPEGARLTDLQLLQEDDSGQELEQGLEPDLDQAPIVDALNQQLNQAVSSVASVTKEPPKQGKTSVVRSLFSEESENRQPKSGKHLENEKKKDPKKKKNRKKDRKKDKRKMNTTKKKKKKK
ncbi:hypothetical protein IGI39_002666 [Enterococcus sp. AZ135]|uniref:DUF2922 family protein n=1 Tax=unclassified Enterococcus TaxID=2608891 RepID=UPI003F225547